MDWQELKDGIVEDVRDRLTTSLGPLLLRQVAGLLTDAAVRLESDVIDRNTPPGETHLHFEEKSPGVSDVSTNRTAGPDYVYRPRPKSLAEMVEDARQAPSVSYRGRGA